MIEILPENTVPEKSGSVKMRHNPHRHKIYQIRIFTTMPPAKAKRTVNARYSKKRRIPSTIFIAPRFVIFVVGPVIINAAADPILIPSYSHALRSISILSLFDVIRTVIIIPISETITLIYNIIISRKITDIRETVNL